MIKATFSTLALLLLTNNAFADDFSTKPVTYFDYNWINKVVNKTPAKRGNCPELEVDKFADGFKVSKKKSFYGSLGAAASRWYPGQELWLAVALSPVKDNFGILYYEANDLNALENNKNKKLPYTIEDFDSWSVKDSAYWESQGGIAFYLGAGIVPFNIGTMAIAKGGWAHYVKKTGPQTAYVEMAKKKVKSVGVSAGVTFATISFERLKDQAVNGIAFEFDLDSNEAIEAYEKLMAGDLTKAQELSQENFPGVKKVANHSERRSGHSFSWGLGTPIIPILSYKASRERYYDQSEENTVWDESTSKNYGVYIEKSRTRLFGLQRNVSKVFEGGATSSIEPNYDNGDTTKKEEVFAKFKYHYEADLGQERRLRMHIEKAQQATGLISETCVRVPEIDQSLKYNQVKLELDLGQGFVEKLIGEQGTTSTSQLLDLIHKDAQSFSQNYFNSKEDSLSLCFSEGNVNTFYNGDCKSNTNQALKKSFAKLREYTSNMKKSYKKDNKLFSKYMSLFGKEVWKSPFTFKAFFERGKNCGQEFNFEVSGRRITRHYIHRKWVESGACL